MNLGEKNGVDKGKQKGKEVGKKRWKTGKWKERGTRRKPEGREM